MGIAVLAIGLVGAVETTNWATREFSTLSGFAAGLLALLALGCIVLGSYWLALGLRPFRLRIDADGVIIQRSGLRAALLWPDIEISLDQNSEQGDIRLIVWPRAGVRIYDAQPDRVVNGMPGYEIADLRELTAGAGKVTEVVRRYAGERYRS